MVLRRAHSRAVLIELVTDRMVIETEKCFGILTWQECEQTCSLCCSFRRQPLTSYPVTLADAILPLSFGASNVEQ